MKYNRLPEVFRSRLARNKMCVISARDVHAGINCRPHAHPRLFTRGTSRFVGSRVTYMLQIWLTFFLFLEFLVIALS